MAASPHRAGDLRLEASIAPDLVEPRQGFLGQFHGLPIKPVEFRLELRRAAVVLASPLHRLPVPLAVVDGHSSSPYFIHDPPSTSYLRDLVRRVTRKREG